MTAAITILVLTLGLIVGLYSAAGSAASGGGAAGLARAAVDQVKDGVNSVASIFSGRSPGHRAAGTLTNLKHKRSVALHERALPKIRTAPPPSELANIVAPPPAAPTIVPPAAGPLFNSVAELPGVGPVVAETAPTVFPAFTPAPGGGFIVPPIVPQAPAPPTTPETPQTPAVPEPSSWALMLLGFGLIGWMLRRHGGWAAILD